ncbi:hypothetical protein [Variovorax saccharolyticus]|uniref:hypothetical protein n=1 Tax=Variovorax saccharolyticus TaxID=3053516 RepID=UPI002577CC6B|nr:hypothetical protein [Variovorax sp. J22R187]MDM0019379.1 hypothetical protein [Variovorax sp. J22R187]
MPSNAPDLRDTRELHLFNGGPPLRLLRLWGRFDPDHQHVVRRALIVACVGWLPLLLLALLSIPAGHDEVWRAFLRDASVHARSLIVAPLLVLAEAACIPLLGELAHTFRDRGLIPATELPAYERVVHSIRRLRDWWLVEAVAVVLAYVLAVLLVTHVPTSFLPDWHRSASEGAPLGRSPASWWAMLVSLPLLLVLLLGWAWRIFLWALYLWRVSRLDLRLVASHPEGAGGLMFVSYSLNSFSLLGIAIGVIVAALELAHLLAGGDITPEQLGRVAFGSIVFVLVLFTAPLLCFCAPLLRTWRQGVKAYGALAQRVGTSLEDRWMRSPPGPETAEPLSSPDFSAVADLFQSVEKAYQMRVIPVELRSAFTLAMATALPFGVVALALVPFDKVLEKMVGLFL